LGNSLIGAKPGETRKYRVEDNSFEVKVVRIRN
jgi:hypothetical protein